MSLPDSIESSLLHTTTRINPSRATMPTTDLVSRAKIAALSDDGRSYGYIAESLNIPKATVAFTIKRYKKHGTLEDLPRSGRPSKLNARAKRAALRSVKQDKSSSTPKAMIEKQGLNISSATMRRLLKEGGITSNGAQGSSQ